MHLRIKSRKLKLQIHQTIDREVFNLSKIQRNHMKKNKEVPTSLLESWRIIFACHTPKY